MNYKKLYIELAYTLTDLNCLVCDHDFWGYCNQVDFLNAIIIIKPNMSYKEKYCILAHEAGHLFYMKKINKFNRSKKPRSEAEANEFALRLLEYNDIEEKEYHNVYEKAKKRAKKRKKSWFEI
jgi:Zn-dependent peptidase ImmA (M78 family)